MGLEEALKIAIDNYPDMDISNAGESEDWYVFGSPRNGNSCVVAVNKETEECKLVHFSEMDELGEIEME